MNVLVFDPATAEPGPLAALWTRAARSLESSVVLKAAHVCTVNRRRRTPRSMVTCSNEVSVCSVCTLSFAYACQQPMTNRRSRISLLWGSGRSPSSTGIIHYWDVSLMHRSMRDVVAYLKDVLKVVCRKLLHLRYIVCKPSNLVFTKWCNQAEPGHTWVSALGGSLHSWGEVDNLWSSSRTLPGLLADNMQII